MEPTYKRGFTLLELMIVIAIIGLLSTIVLANLQSAKIAAKDDRRKSDFRQLQIALELYYLDHGSYPATPVGLNRKGNEWLDSNHNPNDYIPGLVPKYISQLPQEPDQNPTLCLADSPPTTGDNFGTSYRYRSDGTSYKIHDHCEPATPADNLATHPNDPFQHCISNNGASHPSSWSVCGGPIPCSTLYCTDTSGGNAITDADNANDCTQMNNCGL